MSAFNFAKGNALKLLALPIYGLGAIAAATVPRKRGVWVFGSGPGVGEGALPLYLLASRENPNHTLSWLARDRRDRERLRKLGIPATRKSSPLGFLRTLRADVIVVTHGFGDVNRYATRGAFIVQLWHGVPLKLIQLDSPVTTTIGIPGGGRLRAILRRFYRRGFDAIELFPAASELVAARLRTAFGLPHDRVVVTGDPRDDVLSRGDDSTRRSAARATITEHLGELPPRVLLYAPTWRDGATDPGAPTLAQWQATADYLNATDTLLLIRPHPLGVGDYSEAVAASERIVMLGSDLLTDITPALSAIDVLITDYSSIAFDYSLTGGPILFLAADEDSYTASRGLYEPYREFSGGRAVRQWDALLEQLRRYDCEPGWADAVRAHTKILRERHFTFADGRNTERVYAEILTRLGQRR